MLFVIDGWCHRVLLRRHRVLRRDRRSPALHPDVDLVVGDAVACRGGGVHRHVHGS